jgi:Tol biopolymer transport system component
VAVAGSGRTVTLVGGDGAARLALAASPGSTLAVLTTAPDLVDRSPGFAPDGSTIVFVRVPAAASEHSSGIWLVGPDGRELRQVSTDGTDPFWLP